MSQTPASQSSAMRRFKQQAYVDIPSSPVPLSRYSIMSKLNSIPHVHVASVASSGILKENLSLTPTYSSMNKSSTISRKRVLSEHGAPLGTKKQKLAKPGTQGTLSAQPPVPILIPATKTLSDYPNGALYCHQCARKYDVAASVQCTMSIIFTTKDGFAKERRCSGKFCGKCLKNRYGENIDEIKNPANRNQEHGHIQPISYTFECPKCRGICNCWSCRRSKGLEPTGKFGITQTLVQNIKGINLKSRRGIVSMPPDAASRREMATNMDSAVRRQRSKPLIPINWMSITTNLSLDEAEMRFQIREFTLRFSCIMEPAISKVHIDELDDVCSFSKRSSDMAGWISETCVRAILLGVLYLLGHKDNHNIEKSLKATIKCIHASGANLNKMWSALLSLRESLAPTFDSKEVSTITFPDPFPPPSSSSVHTTRNMRTSSAISVQVSNSAQMVPVLNALIEAAFDTDLVREELENGAKEGREITRKVREGLRKVHDEWDNERKCTDLTQHKPEGPLQEARVGWQAHKQRIQCLENSLKVVLSGFAPRFAPLGRDEAGRIFYALSPGDTERKAALGFITLHTTVEYKMKGRIKAQVWNKDKREMMKNWSYFVVVWGKRPSNETQSSGRKRMVNHVINGQAHSDDLDAYRTEEGEDESWWGFYQPKDIRNIAEWIATSSADKTSNGPCSPLIKNLKEYATMLEWRIREDKYEVELK
ncbi:hypothetical protein BDZ94DRAFT_1320552 [Collybia nuda]|uniref:Zinc-finger domain-containing protein n=1 Tax=Collybia nuda TaxID=64659 RepID=A0A9P5YC40_9AGAR|nr:hypothetical protein BDZ94DRAFT_1320552 [Collybia nuda]